MNSICKKDLKTIRNMFVRKIEMKHIEKEVGLKEWRIRKIIKDRKWDVLRKRYYLYLLYYSWKNNITLETIARSVKVPSSTLYRIRRLSGLPKNKKPPPPNKKITKEIEDLFVSDYLSGISGNEICKKYGYKTSKTVYDVLRKRGIDRREAKIMTYYDESFFEKIDSHEKAYVLGLIMSDGYILNDYMGFGIQLTESDSYLLEKIRDIIGGKNPISHIDCSNKRKTLKNAKDMSRLVVSNKKISLSLRNLGVVRNKSKVLTYKEDSVPCVYFSSFVRGLFDGDGSVGISSRGYYWAHLSSASIVFLEKISKYIPFSTGLYEMKNKRYGSHYYIGVKGGQLEIFRFYNWLYKDKGDFYLRRKYAKVQSKINKK